MIWLAGWAGANFMLAVVLVVKGWREGLLRRAPVERRVRRVPPRPAQTRR